ncbi:hypothetical protein [Arthrobacter caoxuetaonis]|uniref:Uncharacterized protein n=1 Tax=Arthrobacter caoxuetaonis TaxID=2886935 RepID=A0A9X1MGJ9_9MICC|nr:hypothetical protein [Arthrobacter caoxuetaonis]MCC3299733.1 hypothetical protein [Arthrobacter caoxuetaonis]USQ59365.1 hypothetical protein NF551_17555 [Arthrobacter caoxuetaonis]
MNKRYTAIVKIVEVEETVAAGQPRRHMDGAPNPSHKTDTEILSVTMRSESLEELKEQLAAHVGLVKG